MTGPKRTCLSSADYSRTDSAVAEVYGNCPDHRLQVLSSEDLTAAVVSQLTWLPDILRCSVVSKTWLAASYKLRLHAIDIPRESEELYNQEQQLDEGSLDSIVRLVQHWHKIGALRDLTRLSLQLDARCTIQCTNSGHLPGFIRSVLTIAGMWDNLQHCSIRAYIDVEVPAPLLSSNLQSLEIGYQSLQNVKDCMLMLHRLSNLRSLSLGPIPEWGDSPEHLQEPYILGSTFHKLTKLHLKCQPLQVSTGCTLSGCLPNVTDLVVCVVPSEAQAVLDLPRLTRLNLGLLCKSSDYHRLRVPPSSSLQQMCVWATAYSFMELNIQKLDLKFRFIRIEVKYDWPKI